MIVLQLFSKTLLEIRERSLLTAIRSQFIESSAVKHLARVPRSPARVIGRKWI